MNNEKVIMYDSPEAARPVKMLDDSGQIISTGFLSIDDFFFNEESMARYRSCTHRTCDCGSMMERAYTACEECRTKARWDRYNQKEFKTWDLSEPVYCELSDKYFFGVDELEDYLENEELSANDVRLMICEPNHYGHVESDYWYDELPEDGDIEPALQKRLDELNEFIKTLPPISWSPGKFRTTYHPNKDRHPITNELLETE